MGHIIDSTYIYGTFFAVIPYVKVTLMITFLSVGLGTILGLLSCVLQQNKVPVLVRIIVPQYSEHGSLIPCVLWLANFIPRLRGSNGGACAF